MRAERCPQASPPSSPHSLLLRQRSSEKGKRDCACNGVRPHLTRTPSLQARSREARQTKFPQLTRCVKGSGSAAY